MSLDSIPQTLIRHPESSKPSKSKPPILLPSIDAKAITPNVNTKFSSRSLPKKNFVPVRKFNSSLAASGGNQENLKLPPKLHINQHSTLSNLPDHISSIPLSPKAKHRRSENQSQQFESKQVESNSYDRQASMSKLAINDTDYSSETYNQVQEEPSDNSSVDNSADHNFLKSSVSSRKRKPINYSGSFDLSRKNTHLKINNSFSFIDFQKKVSKPHSHSAHQSDCLSPLQDPEETHIVSSRLSLSPHSADEQMITIQFISNWGNPKSILLSTVTVMDEKKKSIPIKTISSVPDLPKINLLEKFTDHKLVKDENDVFPIDFDLSANDKFSLILTIDKTLNPRYIRIWNPTLKDETLSSASVKNVIIYLNHKKVCIGEVPQNFGADLELKQDKSEKEETEQCNASLLIDELFPSYKTEEKIYDTYGIYPFEKAKTITIEVLSTYKNNPERIDLVGLNGVDFYNDKGIKLKKAELDFISVRNMIVSPCANPKLIVRESMKTCTLDYQFIANCQQEFSRQQIQYKSSLPASPMFIFTFFEPTSISMMRIWNFNSIKEELDNGIQKVIIRCNNKVTWSGKIKKGIGLLKGIERSATDIWFTDSTSIREHVSKLLLNDLD